MGKINGKQRWLLVIGLFILLIYTRFINIGWGLPYPMHPDERNMVNAIQTLNCRFSIYNLQFSNFKDCFNPHFFAYGQLPLYLGYFVAYFLKFFDGDLGLLISFQEATISLRTISAIASIINFIIIIKIINVISKKKSHLLSLIAYLIIIFAPFAIQFAHFGTTESLLMMFYSVIIYFSLLHIDKKIGTLTFVLKSSLIVGMSMATKVSSLIFLVVPFSVLLFNLENFKQKTIVKASQNSIIFYGYRIVNKLMDLFILIFLTSIIFILLSPHNLINLNDFLGSMRYESDVALGKSLVFYTRQFFSTVPVIFQSIKVFPFTLGWPAFVLGVLGFLGGLGWKDKKINLLRFAFLIYFIPSAIIYAKWSRFMAPILPLIIIFAILLLLKIKVINFIKIIIVIIAVVPGLAYLSIYQTEDVRFQASDWIYKNIPNDGYLFFETANVVDVPIQNPKTLKEKTNQVPLPNYKTVSFNFYDLDESLQLQTEFGKHLEKADYIFVPSRRVVANHTCYNIPTSLFELRGASKNHCIELKNKYPILNKYYEDLFSGKLGFEKVAEFNSFPKIQLFGKTLIEFPDEDAEETWTVFDHPVIRIYKRVIKNPKL